MTIMGERLIKSDRGHICIINPRAYTVSVKFWLVTFQVGSKVGLKASSSNMKDGPDHQLKFS